MENQKLKVVIIEDNLHYNKVLTRSAHLTCEELLFPKFDFEVRSFLSIEKGINAIKQGVDIVIFEYHLVGRKELEGNNSLSLLKLVYDINPDSEVLLIRAQQNIIRSVNLIKNSIIQYVNNNLKDDLLATRLKEMKDWVSNRFNR